MITGRAHTLPYRGTYKPPTKTLNVSLRQARAHYKHEKIVRVGPLLQTGEDSPMSRPHRHTHAWQAWTTSLQAPKT